MEVKNSIIYKLLISIYIIYILVYFKTSYSVYHPLEVILQNNLSVNSILKHPLYNTGLYENKVCGLGHIMAFLLAFWILNRKMITNNQYTNINNWIWYIIMTLSLILNPNVFVYLLPVFCLEIFLN